ncbi:MAG: polysaccharide biosynthesis protein [Chloroflexi bacterium]|nr:polysaccharide biosynthesis protein [Chloroflexota bacterium]
MSLWQLAKSGWARSGLTNGTLRKLVLLSLDGGAIVLSICLSLIMYGEGWKDARPWALGAVVLLALLAKLPIFLLLGTYRISLSYFGLRDAIDVIKVVSLGSAVFGGMAVLGWPNSVGGFDLSLVIADFLFTMVFVGGIRAVKRIRSQVLRWPSADSVRRVLVAGAGSAGELTLRALAQEKDPHHLPVAMVDDDPMKQGMTIQGVPVLGKHGDIPRLAGSLGVHELLIAMPSAHPAVLREIVQLGRKAGLKKIKVLPALHQLINGKVTVSDLRDIQIEDLLGREPVQIATQEIESCLKDKVVLVTGAAGSIGSELCHQVAAFRPAQMVVLDQDETGLFHLRRNLKHRSPRLSLGVVVGDIRDKDRMRQVFSRFRPAVVFHTAAYKHVSMMEENPREAIRNNVFGTRTVGEAAIRSGAEKFVLISTDKAVNPTSIMGATKRLAEMVVKDLNERNCCRFISVRFGNVLGSRGSVVPIFWEQIQRGGPVTVTHPEMRRYFMTPAEAALLVMQAGAIGSGGEVLVLDMGDPVAIVDLAREMIQLAGLEPDKDIPIVFSSPLPGEKLFEDILTAEEGTTATKHRRIFVAKTPPARSGETLHRALAQLETLVMQDSHSALIEALSGLVPNYSPAVESNDVRPVEPPGVVKIAPLQRHPVVSEKVADGTR